LQEKDREYLKNRISKLVSKSNIKIVRVVYGGINKFKNCDQPRSNLLRDRRASLLADPHKVLNRWKNYFCQLLNVQGADSVRQTEMQTAKPFLPQPMSVKMRLQLGRSKDINLQVLIRFQENWFRLEGKCCIRIFINLFS
jgi:hypothetical protein